MKSTWYEQYEKSKDGTKNPWHESSMVRNVHQWYETSKVRKVYGTKSPAFLWRMAATTVLSCDCSSSVSSNYFIDCFSTRISQSRAVFSYTGLRSIAAY